MNRFGEKMEFLVYLLNLGRLKVERRVPAPWPVAGATGWGISRTFPFILQALDIYKCIYNPFCQGFLISITLRGKELMYSLRQKE